MGVNYNKQQGLSLRVTLNIFIDPFKKNNKYFKKNEYFHNTNIVANKEGIFGIEQKTELSKEQ